MRYAIVKDGVCVNAIEADETFAESIGAIDLPDGYGPGDLFDGYTWTKTEQTDDGPTFPVENDTSVAQLRADIDYLSVMLGVELL